MYVQCVIIVLFVRRRSSARSEKLAQGAKLALHKKHCKKTNSKGCVPLLLEWRNSPVLSHVLFESSEKKVGLRRVETDVGGGSRVHKMVKPLYQKINCKNVGKQVYYRRLDS